MSGSSDLELDALRVSFGADIVQRQLLAGLSVGNPPIDSLIYMSKCRVKDHSRLVLKILDRRAGANGNPGYRAEDVTDIVGLRLLTLYRNELAPVVKAFLQYAAAAQAYPFSLFIGPTLHETISEVIIYRRSPISDVTDDVILEQFTNVGFDHVIVPYGESAKNFTQKVKIVCKPSEYSSIHIVMWSAGKKGGRTFKIPVEVQIRTAVEDVWGEIDHALKYKSLDIDPATLTGISKEIYQSASQYLIILKQQLDLSSKTADLIHQQISAVRSEGAYGIKQEDIAMPRSVDTHMLLTFSLDPAINLRLRQVVAEIDALFSEIFSDVKSHISADIRAFISRFLNVAQELASCALRVEGSAATQAIEPKALYYLKMERALCLYWSARLVKYRLVRLEGIGENLKEADAYLEDSLQQYLELQKGEFRSEPVLHFRIANAWALRGEAAYSLESYRNAYRFLLEDTVLPQDHSMRVRIPRFLGIVLWDLAERKRREGELMGNPDYQKEIRQAQYLEALDVTNSALGICIATNDIDRVGWTPEDEEMVTKNNLLEYSVCFLRAGGDAESLESRGIGRNRIQEYLELLVKDGADKISRPTLADTARAVARFLDQDSLARIAAQRVLELLDNDVVDWNVDLTAEAYQEMRANAEAELKRPIAQTSDS